MIPRTVYEALKCDGVELDTVLETLPYRSECIPTSITYYIYSEIMLFWKSKPAFIKMGVHELTRSSNVVTSQCTRLNL